MERQGGVEDWKLNLHISVCSRLVMTSTPGLCPPPGCLLTGFLLVNRVPGNFHIEARSKYHNLNPALTNVSHIVHDLTFGPPMTKDYRLQLKVTHG